jgi:hypothetical protein
MQGREWLDLHGDMASDQPSTLLTALVTKQARLMAKTMANIIQFLDYLATQRCNNDIQCKQHDTSSPQQCWICKQEKGMKSHRRTFLSVKQQHSPPQQRGNIDSCNNHQSSHVVSGRSRIGSIIWDQYFFLMQKRRYMCVC